jgi:protein arginine kinase activator
MHLILFTTKGGHFMLCEKCNQNEATVHFRQNINGDVKEVHLCPQCAAELGYDSIFSGFESMSPFVGLDIGVQNFLGSLFSQELPARKAPESRKCSFCGATFEEFAQSAMAGCTNCYHEFSSDMLPYIQRIHGRTRHVGKVPATAGKELKLQRELTTLKKQLDDAVAVQEYEKAAQFRDQIKEIEKKVQDN